MILNSAGDYELIEDVLYYWPKKHRKNGSVIEKRLVVPKRFRPELIQLHHSSLFAGHLGAEKTYLRLQRNYFWVNMYKETHDHCHACDICQKAKLTKRQLPIMQHKTYCGMPFSDCYTDFIGPLPSSDSMNHIIVFICPFTKWVEAKAVKDNDAETAAMAFVELIVARHGVPDRIISDQGSHFTAQRFQQTMKILQTRNVFTTPYHAQSNGQCERMNGTLVQLLRVYCQNNKEKWAEYLPYALFAYRCTVHESTGHTPFEMIYGRNPVLPGEEKLLAVEEQGIDEFIKNLKHAIQQVHEMARNKLKKMQMAHYAKDTPKNVKKFSVGEKVLVKSNDPRRHKFEYVYDGPFTILEEVHGGVAYKIDQPKPTLGKTTCTVSISHLKKYKDKPG
jgi:ribosomal protein L21E